LLFFFWQIGQFTAGGIAQNQKSKSGDHGGVTQFEWTTLPKLYQFSRIFVWTEMIMLKFFF
jgi:hypothetical protein